MSRRCSRLWEVEAARDGRMVGSARDAIQLHVQHCQDCADEQRALDGLGARLRNASEPSDDEPIALRRLRGRVLAAAQQAQFEDRRDKLSAWLRAGSARWLAGAGLLAAVVLAVLVVQARNAARPEPVALHLTAAPGARFTHERRADLEYVELLEGSLNIAFDRSRNPKADLWVRTPDGEIRDYGTKFRVSVENGRTRELSVREGAVLFRRLGEPELVIRAGESYRAEVEAPPPMAASEPESPAQAVEEVVPAPAPSEPPRRVKTQAAPRKQVAPAPSSAALEDRAYLELLEHLRANRSEEAHAAAEAYLRSFPNGFRRVEVERIAARRPAPVTR